MAAETGTTRAERARRTAFAAYIVEAAFTPSSRPSVEDVLALLDDLGVPSDNLAT